MAVLDFLKNAISSASHLHTFMYFMTDAFSSGTSWQKGDDPTAAYRKMLDEAVGVNTYWLLRQRLEAEGLDVDELYRNTSAFFAQNPVYIEAWRESLAAVSDAEARVEMLREFVLADETEKIFLCQLIDQRHPAARAVYNRFVNAKAVWKRVLAKELGYDDASHIRVFLASLNWLQQHQFQSSIGALTSADDRQNCLSEVLAAYPNLNQMRGIATTRGLIKEPGEVEKAIRRLATPRPNDPAETAAAQAQFDTARNQLRQTLNRNPLARFFR